MTNGTVVILFACIGAVIGLRADAADGPAITFGNDYATLAIGPDARGVQLIDRQSGRDCARHDPEAAIARVRVAGQEHQATSASVDLGRLSLTFGDSGVTTVIGVRPLERYFILRVLEVRGEGIEELTFCDIHLALKGSADEPFAACALALNLKTNVREIPGANSRLRAMCYPRFGLKGAEVAIVACPKAQLRDVMKEAVSAAKELPQSPVGGPWAMDGPLNRTSYLFNFGGMSEETVDQWIARAKSIGFNQIQIHGGRAFRFGDCRLDPETYPNGFAGMRAVVDRLHAAGIAVGIQPYAFFIDKRCPWVTPKPDPRLAKDAGFTLSAALAAADTDVPVDESTEKMSTITGFFVRNSVTLQIDDELITYSGISKEPPYAFTGCRRGALGTQAAPHAKGAQAHHLKECFGLFVPDPDSTLLEEVAAKTAELFNECGFDCIYLDALDGEDVLGGGANGWHYGSKYVFELWKRLEKPAVMEYSTFHHHLWYVRSRMGAWDHPSRSHKAFIDMHVAANRSNDRTFLPSNLGWWAFKTWGGTQTEPTFPDDIEYLCAKAIATDSGLSCTTYDPSSAGQQRLAEIVKRYEAVRHAGTVPESVKAALREPRRDFTLVPGAEDTPRFRPMRYDRHRVEGIDGRTNTWQVRNEFGPQPIALRIEALSSCGSYDAEDNLIIADLAQPDTLPDRAANDGVTVDLQPSTEQVKVGESSGRLIATSTLGSGRGSWAKIGRRFDPVLNLSAHQALGVWIHGDGQGELLNFQLRSPHHISHGIADHYVIIDFTGWRYFELIEPEGERWADYSWPYGGAYAIYRELVNFSNVESFAVWVNNLPANGQIECCLSPVKGLPVFPIKLANPRITAGETTITFPVEIETGQYLEFRAMDDCKLYGATGEPIGEVTPTGAVPDLAAGDNQVTFTCDAPDDINPRARVTVIAQGEPMG